ncbi:MAG TPA: nitrile hydratase accessory protein [Candidatus Binataceae bacterium]|nr:nitrile hydratase accessory protein [Candidatus Binataceae bacterium]
MAATDALELLAREQEPVFNEPWEARVFGLTLVLVKRGLFSYEEFRQQLIARINGPDSSSSYYVNWMAALEQTLAQRGALNSNDIEQALAALAPAVHA